MIDIQSGWNRRGMPSDVADSALATLAENNSTFQHDLSGPRKDQGALVIQMVHQAAELIRGMDQQAADIESRAQALARRLIAELELAEQRLCSADAARQASEARINEANIRVHEADIALENAESLIASIGVKLSAAERQADAAETRAKEADKALIRIEDEIRIHLLGQRSDASSNLAAAA